MLGKEKKKRGRGVKKDERLIFFADGKFKKLLHFLCIDWKLLILGGDVRIECVVCSESEKLNVSFLLICLIKFFNW